MNTLTKSNRRTIDSIIKKLESAVPQSNRIHAIACQEEYKAICANHSDLEDAWSEIEDDASELKWHLKMAIEKAKNLKFS